MNNEFYLEGDGWGTRQICPLTPKKENKHLAYNEEDSVYSFKNENNLRIEIWRHVNIHNSFKQL